MFTNLSKSKTLLRFLAFVIILTSLLGAGSIPSAQAQSGTTEDGNTPVESPVLEPMADSQELPSPDMLPSSEVTALAADARVRVTPTTSVPWKYIARIQLVYPDGSSKICTGFFIGPFTVVTAGHCVHDMARVKNPGDVSGWAISATVYPAYDAGSTPYGGASAYQLYSTLGWVQNQDPLYDYGAIYLAAPLGNTVGWFNYGYFSDSFLNSYFSTGVAHVAGYPLDKDAACPGGNPAGCPWDDNGVVSITTNILNYTISTDVDTPGTPPITAGEDGAPIWINDSGNLYAIGLNLFSAGNALCSSGKNCGLRITNGVASNLYTWSKIMPLTDPMGAGIYDDTSASWVYGGTWSTYAGAGPYNNTDHYTNTAGDTATFSFTGIQFIYTYVTASNRGNIEVRVDGTLVTTLNAYTASMAWQKTYTSPVYTYGAHTVTFKLVGPAGTYMDVDAIRVIAPMEAGTYDDTNSAWAYDGGVWSTYTGAGPYNNTDHYINTVGATASIVFTGMQFTYTYVTGSNRGNIEVWLDGALVTTLNANTPTMVWQKTYVSPIYSAGIHTVTFKLTGPAGTYMDVDAIQIANPDFVAPSEVGSLTAVTGKVGGDIDLSWTAPMNDAGSPSSGPVNSYQVRYSTSNIVTEADWTAATAVTSGIPAPWTIGATQTMTVNGLMPGVLYYVAVRGQDKQPNLGPIVVASAVAKQPDPVGAGTYDDVVPAWIYGGTWNTYSGTGPYNNTVHYSNVPGATATFAFMGTQFIYTYLASNNRGSIEVWVDGALVTTLNANSTVMVWQKTYTSPIYAMGIHTVVLKLVGSTGQYMDVDAIQIINMADDISNGWIYSGAWNTYNGTGPINNTDHYTSQIGATASFLFTGTQFVYYYITGSNRGNIEVWVDGALVTTINANSTVFTWQKAYTSPIFSRGTHTITFKFAGAAGKYMDVDAIQFFDLADDTNSAWTYSGTWNTYAGPGPYNNTDHYTNEVGASASISFNGIQFTYTYLTASNRGNIEVWVDGVWATTINANTTAFAWQTTYTSQNLPPGSHTVTFRLAGPAGQYMDIDAIQFTNFDNNPPSAVGSLAATGGASAGSINLSWTAPMNDAGVPSSGPVNAYLVRYSTSNIVTEADWAAATVVSSGIPTPGAVGASQNMTLSGLMPGVTYYVAVRGLDAQPNKGPIAVASGVATTPVPVGTGTYDDFNTAWVYGGTWSTYTGSGPLNGTDHYTNTADGMATVSFTGSQFIYTYATMNNRGNIEVWVDGALITTLNANSTSTVWQKTYTSPTYATGTHTVTFKLAGAAGQYMDVDAIQILP